MKKRYVQVGTGGRARFFYEAIASTYKDTSEMVGFCDLSQTRMDYANKILTERHNQKAVPTYHYTDFEKMLDDLKPDVCVNFFSVTFLNPIYYRFLPTVILLIDSTTALRLVNHAKRKKRKHVSSTLRGVRDVYVNLIALWRFPIGSEVLLCGILPDLAPTEAPGFTLRKAIRTARFKSWV